MISGRCLEEHYGSSKLAEAGEVAAKLLEDALWEASVPLDEAEERKERRAVGRNASSSTASHRGFE